MAPRKPESAQEAKRPDKTDRYRIKKVRSTETKQQVTVTKHDNGLLKVEPKGTLQKLAVRNSETSPLLRLPFELRMKIYGYALGGNEYRIYIPKSKPVCAIEGGTRGECCNLQLQSVCTQVYSETATLPFSQNTFCVWPYLLHRWLHTLIPGHRDAIETINVNFPEAKYGIIELRQFKGLQQVRVCYAQGSPPILRNVAMALQLCAQKPELQIVFRPFD